MQEQPDRTGRLLTISIVVLSVAGVLYFGTRAVLDQGAPDRPNPYAYDLSVFEHGRADSLAFAEIRTIPLSLAEPKGLARDRDGFLYVTGDRSVRKFDGSGTPVSTFPTRETAYCLAVDGKGRIYLGMKDRIEVLGPSGNPVAQWESLGPNAIVTSVAVSDSTVGVADAGQLRVWKFTPSGSLLGIFGRKDRDRGVPGFVVPSPYFDVAFGPDGSLWAANTGRHSLENYAADGALTASWGEYSAEIGGFAGCCNPSHFAVMGNGAFVTSEKGVARVKVYDPQGRFVAMVAGPDRFREGTEGLDLTVDDRGRVYVLDPVRKAVRVFSMADGKGRDPE